MCGFFNINNWVKWKYIPLSFYSIICFLWNMYLHTVFIWCCKKIIISLDAVSNQTSNKKCLLELFERRPKVDQRTSQGHFWNFAQWKEFFGRLIGVFVYNITESNCCSRDFVEFI